jgi:serralysin
MRIAASLPPAVPVAAILAALTVLTVPAPAAHAASPRMDRMERKVVRLINHRRARAGLRAVRLSVPLARAADFHTREMLAGDYFAHPSRNGGSFSTRIHRFTGARRVGETLAWMSRCRRGAARVVVSMWMQSPPHRAILMSGSFHRVGLGRRTGHLGNRRACVVTGDFAR